MRQRLQIYGELFGLGERLRLLLLVGVALTVTIIEAMGAVLVFVLLGLVTGAEAALQLPVVGDVRDRLPPVEESTLLLGAAAAVAGFFILRAIAVLARFYIESRIVENAGARLAHRLANGYFSLPYAFHLRRNSAELIRNAYSNTSQVVNGVFRPLVRIGSESFVAIGIFGVLVLTAPLATLLVLILLSPTIWVLLRVIYPRLRDLGAGSQRLSKDSLQHLQQGLHGIRDIKLLGRSHFFAQEFGRTRFELARVNYIQHLVSHVPSVGIETLLVVFISGLFAVTVMAEGTAVQAVPVLGLFAYAAMRLKPSLGLISGQLNALQFSAAGVEHVRRDLALFDQANIEKEPSTRPEEALPFEKEITLENVSFRYEGTEVNALNDVSLRIRQREALGIVGPTGGGKTTLIDVILGLLQPRSGTVCVDGRDIHDQVTAWQMNLGLVPQDLFLADDTLRRNIALGRHASEIDEERVAEAVRLAQLEGFVESLPDGLDTVVGERGVRLSGGQRQRVAIARALYPQPKVLVFDEGTSALDNLTEADLMRAIEGLRDRMTLIIVAHRLSTVRNADQVAVIRGGRLTGLGTFDELVKTDEHFRQLTS
jgi:ATP-binding cassette, subfamily B, bacterial PglK